MKKKKKVKDPFQEFMERYDKFIIDQAEMMTKHIVEHERILNVEYMKKYLEDTALEDAC
jgi:hypothetical protein